MVEYKRKTTYCSQSYTCFDCVVKMINEIFILLNKKLCEQYHAKELFYYSKI